MLGSENSGELIVPIVMSLIGAPPAAAELDADDVAAAGEDDEALELDEFELLLPHAATPSALTIVTTSTTRRWFTASLLSRSSTSRRTTPKGCTYS
jgi:hypothetical protein